MHLTWFEHLSHVHGMLGRYQISNFLFENDKERLGSKESFKKDKHGLLPASHIFILLYSVGDPVTIMLSAILIDE